jgi:GNAT superfamily N-acetyltransferase
MEDSILAFMEAGHIQLLVAVDGDGIVGVHAGGCYADWFTDDLRADSFLIYVAKRARGGLTAKRMVKRYEDWAFGLGAKKVTVGFASGGDIDRMGGLLQRLGYDPVGGVFEKEAD